jgi:stearoyl-CoA desaturase (Delta-9 desaturase)
MFDWHWAVLLFLIIVIITSTTYSIFVHRAMGHKLLTIGPGLTYFFRIWLWLTGYWYPGGSLRKFSAGHRKHHAFSDSVDDPHSPYFFSAKEIYFTVRPNPTSPYYLTPEEITKWASDVPVYNDWLEKQFEKYYKIRFPALLTLILILFGFWVAIFAIAGLLVMQLISRSHNYLSHKIGYRNRPPIGTDRSKNMFPIGLIYAGEELAANHHDHPARVKNSEKWWEFDFGWGIILILKFFGMLKINSTK